MRFNQAQQKIISSLKGAYLISAPVGTGKTTILSERIIKAIESGIKPEEILCLTFTNRAVEEMRSRIRKKISSKNVFDSLTLSTFHGFCAYFIRAEAKSLGISSDFTIFDEIEQAEILKEILEDYPEFNFDDNKAGLNPFINELYKRREANLEIEIGCKMPEPKKDKILDEINKRYLLALQRQNALDYNELVLTVIRALYTDKKLQKKWSRKYKLIQLDEFQDTHLSEYLVVKELAKYYKNIAFIGDLDQTIYSWRGSQPYYLVKLFFSHFKPVQEINLEINYRFNKGVLMAVKSFLNNLDNSFTKKIESHKDADDGSKKSVTVFSGYNLVEEASWIIKNINSLKQSDPKARIAVLTRANYLIGQIAGIFKQKGIAHVTVDQYDFFRRQEIKDINAYLKIIFNKFDLESACRVIARPGRGIGLKALETIRGQGDQIGLKISDFLDFKNYNFMEPFFNLIEKWNNGRIIVLDTETTGTNVLRDEIIQIYAIEVVNGKIGKDFHFYMKNSIPVGESEAVHGLSNDFLRKKGRNPKNVLSELKEFINNDITIGHNVNFDLSMISENSKRLDLEFEFNEYYDTLDIARRVIDSENYKLDTLAKKFGLSSATHDARDDVIATVGLLGVLVERLRPNSDKRIEIFKKFSPKFINLANQIKSWQKIAVQKRPAQTLKYIWDDSGLKDYYAKDNDKEKRFKSIKTLIKLFQDKDKKEEKSDIVLRELVRYASLVRDIDFLGLEQGKIPIVTVHQVKGLEFDYVFIVGMNDYRFPIRRQGSDLEEEKRLFYVAMTRARKKIFISYSQFNDYARPLTKSPFIDYIGQEFIEMI